MLDNPPDALMPDDRPPRGEALSWWTAVIVWAALCLVVLFAVTMTRTVTYDEDQYIAAGVMARHLLPYRDFLYLQAPLYPFVLAPLFSWADGWFLLTGRLLTFGLAMVSGVLLWRILRRLGAGPPLTMLLMTACLTSPFLASPLANTRNDALPLALMLAGLAAHLRFVDRSFWGQVLAAVLFGLAAEAKVSYVFAPALLGVHALLAPRMRLAPVLLGTALAGAPAAWCWSIAPEAFRFALLDFHLTGPMDWYGRQGLGALLMPQARLLALLDWCLLGGNLTLLIMSAALSVVAMARSRKWKRPGMMLLAMTVAASALAFVPSPAWAMYYAATAPLLACCVAHLSRVTTHLVDPARRRILFFVAALPCIQPLVLLAAEAPAVTDPTRWVGLQAHRTALDIAARIDAARSWAAAPGDGARDVATLFPIFVLDANPVRREFATGPFVFRSGAAFSKDQLSRLHALSPAMLEDEFARRPPAAIYAGLFPGAWKTPMDAALTAYAEQHGWTLARTDSAGGHLYLRP
jgi:hypothetical protein